MRPSIQILLAVSVFGLAAVGFWFAINGVLSGAVEFPSKHESAQVLLATSPKTFWSCVAVWFAMGVGFVWLGAVNFREAMRA